MESLATPETPSTRPALSNTDLSPPNSQGPASASITSSDSPSAPNANGKRPLSLMDNTPETPALSSMRGPGSAPANGHFERQTHQPSGYSWTQPEDAPGYAWRNKRAVEEAERAWVTVLHKDIRVANRYMDPFEMADREAQMLAARGQ